MKVKLHQVLTAYACDTAQTEVTGKGAQKYLKDNDIVDADVERISEQMLKRQILDMKLKALLLHFYTGGAKMINNWLDPDKEQAPGFEQLYEQMKKEINAIFEL